MRRLAFAIVILISGLAVSNQAHAVVCANGVYRTGCTGPNGAVVARKHYYHGYRPYYRGESGHYRVTSRLEPQAEYHPANDFPKLIAAVVDVETTGTNPDPDKIIEFGVCLFEYDCQTGGSTKSLAPGSGSKILIFRSRLRSRRLPALPMRWSPVTVLTIARSTNF
jgi:hypothetical protein